MKDIFIDNNIASRFSHPLDTDYISLIKWLTRYDLNDTQNCAYLVVSQKLLREYFASATYSNSTSSIPIIVDQMTREGRLVHYSNKSIREAKKQLFTKTILRNLRCNWQDRDHIIIVLKSVRKFAITRDENLLHDLIYFPGYDVTAVRRPRDLAYE